MHCDGMHYFPFTSSNGQGSGNGILCVNNEYTHEEILHGKDGLAGGAGVTIAKVRKSQAAHGVSVVELVAIGSAWSVVENSEYGRRITANTPMRIGGPAAGHALMKSKKFEILPHGSFEIGLNNGYVAHGTDNNCAHGYTPWDTYLTCEENWNGYFVAPSNGDRIDPALADKRAEIKQGNTRYGINAAGFGYEWHKVDPRFDADSNPLEPNLFGWVVEIDPFDPASLPVKRTALGRFKHESAQLAMTRGAGGDLRVAYYMGDDERNEYIYKFVCSDAFQPGNRTANRNLLDRGTLYAARFTDRPGTGAGTYRGQWVALLPGTETVLDDPKTFGRKLQLRELAAFAGADDAEVLAKILIRTRQAADAVGATMMDRPEWTALRTYDDPAARQGGYPVYDAAKPLEIYCTLTNNNRRGGGGSPAGATSSNKADGTTEAGSARPAVDLANPRPDNDYGHIIRWREDGNVVTATGFEWDIFMLCGDKATTKTLASSYDGTNRVGGRTGTGPFYQGDIAAGPGGGADFGAPDGLWFDPFGRLWIQTDQAGDATGDWVNIGANSMACADPTTKEVRRFLTGPHKCEITGVTNTPDGKTLFVGVQHPGEDSPAANPTAFSNWPQSQFAVNSGGRPLPNTPGLRRPRSSVLVITKDDGGIIGT
jgi:secreted PhoX family phosphatase